MKDFFQACNTINGRWNRKKFLLYPLGMSLVLFIPIFFLSSILSFLFRNEILSYLSATAYFLIVINMFYVSITAYIKRFHDLGKSGWYTLLVFVPIVNIFALIWLIFFKGTSGTNIYGLDPLGNNPNILGSDTQSAFQNPSSSKIDL